MSAQIKLEARLVSWPLLLHFFPEKPSLCQERTMCPGRSREVAAGNAVLSSLGQRNEVTYRLEKWAEAMKWGAMTTEMDKGIIQRG